MPAATPPDAAATVAAWFAAHPDLPVEHFDRGEGAWLTTLAGERKRTIPVYLELGVHNLALQSFFMRAPDENEADIYRFLLQRNLRSYVFRFALSVEGDVLLMGLLPRSAVTPTDLDTALGQLLATADDAFNPALRLGFESYIEREQAWRAQVGAGRNPIS